MEKRVASDRHKLQCIFDTVDDLLSYEYDFDTVEARLHSIRKATGICLTCRGSGIDGDPPDAAGIGGWTGPCRDCRDGTRTVWVDQDGDIIWENKPW